MNESNLFPFQSNFKTWKNDNNHDDEDDNGDDNYNAGLTSIDGKCNQLQVDLFSVGTEIDNLKKKIDSLEEDYYHNKNVPPPPPLPQRRQQQRRRQQQLPPRPQCFVVFCSGFIEIYGYSQSSVGVLIGKKGYNIRRIERLYNIRIEIPSKSSSSSSSKNEPIKIFPKSRYCHDLYSLFWGIRCVVDILG